MNSYMLPFDLWKLIWYFSWKCVHYCNSIAQDQVLYILSLGTKVDVDKGVAI